MAKSSSASIGTLAVLTLRGSSILAQLAVFAFLAKTASVADVGLFAISNATWVLGRAVLPLGWDVALLREGSRRWRTGRSGQVRQLLSQSLRQTLAVGATTSVLLAGFTFFFAPDAIDWLACTAVVGIVWALVGLCVSALRAAERPIAGQFADSVLIQIIPAAGAVLMGTVLGELDVLVVLRLYAIGAIAALAYCLVVATARFQESKLMTKRERRSVWRLAWRLLIPQVFSALASRLPVLLTGPLAGLTQTALVETGLRGQLATSTVAWASGIAASPSYASARDSKRAQEMLSIAVWGTMTASVTFLLAVGWVGRPVLEYLGPTYGEAFVAVVLMSVAALVESPAAVAGYYLAMTGRERFSSGIVSIQCVALVAGLIALVPWLGALGAAISVCIASLLRTSLTFNVFYRAGLDCPIHPRGIRLMWRTLISLFRTAP